MDIGMIGLGRMGANMAERLRRGGHRVVGFDPQAKPFQAANALKATGTEAIEFAGSVETLVALLAPPRAVWLMVPAGDPVDQTIAELLLCLLPGDVIVDGGNSNYRDSQRRAETLAERRIDFVDCGTSGGVWGLQEGYSLMLGGTETVLERLRPLFATLAPAADRGWGRVGPSGAGHFTKMIHNGIEYGLMQAYAEGFSLLQHKKEFDLDLHQIADIWRHGSVVRSWLLDLTAAALGENPALDGIAPFVADSGEGRWTVVEALELGVAAPVITMALLARLRSRDPASFSDKLLAALRPQFGGHAVTREPPPALGSD
jgi:6-phosphogluconate dehydrogenase